MRQKNVSSSGYLTLERPLKLLQLARMERHLFFGTLVLSITQTSSSSSWEGNQACSLRYRRSKAIICFNTAIRKKFAMHTICIYPHTRLCTKLMQQQLLNLVPKNFTTFSALSSLIQYNVEQDSATISCHLWVSLGSSVPPTRRVSAMWCWFCKMARLHKTRSSSFAICFIPADRV